MRIATWNVNSVRQRLPHLLDYLKEVGPDALCLQEIKCLDEQFPRLEIEDLGYNVETHGQKGFNGVAILAKRPFEVARGLPGDDADTQSRYIEAVIPTDGGAVRVASIYLPNGNPPDSEKYPYKLGFMERLIGHARKLMDYEEPLVLAGDFNVIPEPIDAARPELWTSDALFLPKTRAKFRELLALGFTDALRATTDAGGPLHVLGLSGGGLAEKQRHPHRSPAVVAAGRRPPPIGGDRQGGARARQSLGPYADPDRTGRMKPSAVRARKAPLMRRAAC